MLIACFRQLLARLRTDATNRISVLRPPLEQLRRQRRDPRRIARRHDDRRDEIYVRLGQPRRYHPFTAPTRHVTSIDCITEFWWPHIFSPPEDCFLAVEKTLPGQAR